MPKLINETYITKEWYYLAVFYKKVGMNNKGTAANRIIRGDRYIIVSTDCSL
jgi:hypothetical protein